MNTSLMHALVNVTIISSIAIVLVGILRKPLRRFFGARATYWVWLLVPASALALLLPAPTSMPRTVVATLSDLMSTTLSSGVESSTTFGTSINHIDAEIAVWITGVLLMLFQLFRRQLAFVRSLGNITTDSDGTRRGNSIIAPVVIYAWHPQVIVPVDFEGRYTHEEQEAVLAHEHAHLKRRDTLINTITCGWLCLCWFNPLMYWAIGRLRFDQELACDAHVLELSKITRAHYANALLKTQLATDSTWHAPIGCHWQSAHPLKERIAMLKHSSPGLVRRLTGITFVLALAVCSSYAVWATQPNAQLPNATGTPITVNLKWLVNGVDVLIPGGSSIDIHTTAGNEFVRTVSLARGQINEIRCIASLPDSSNNQKFWEAIKASGQNTNNLILLTCKLSHNEKIFASPAITLRDSKPGLIEVADSNSNVHFKLEINASISKENAATSR